MISRSAHRWWSISTRRVNSEASYDSQAVGDGWSCLRRPHLFSRREKRWGRKERFSVTGVYRMRFRWEIGLTGSASTGLPVQRLTTRRSTIGTKIDSSTNGTAHRPSPTRSSEITEKTYSFSISRRGRPACRPVCFRVPRRSMVPLEIQKHCGEIRSAFSFEKSIEIIPIPGYNTGKEPGALELSPEERI